MDGDREKEVMIIELKHHKHLEQCMEEGMIFAGYSPRHQVTVIALQGGAGTDWAAYIDTPYGMAANGAGTKLPRSVAESLFPRWGEKYMWRD